VLWGILDSPAFGASEVFVLQSGPFPYNLRLVDPDPALKENHRIPVMGVPILYLEVISAFTSGLALRLETR